MRERQTLREVGEVLLENATTEVDEVWERLDVRLQWRVGEGEVEQRSQTREDFSVDSGRTDRN